MSGARDPQEGGKKCLRAWGKLEFPGARTRRRKRATPFRPEAEPVRSVTLPLALCALLGALSAPALAPAPARAHAGHAEGATCGDDAREACEEGALAPSYEPRPPAEPPVYTTDYFFATTRAVASSTIVPAGRVPLFFLTIPIDTAFLPIAAIAGFFPGD